MAEMGQIRLLRIGEITEKRAHGAYGRRAVPDAQLIGRTNMKLLGETHGRLHEIKACVVLFKKAAQLL